MTLDEMLSFWARRLMLTAPLRHSSSAAAANIDGRPLPESVQIVEVGPRDGLQNERVQVPLDTKLELVHRLADCGLRRIEVTSFVSPRWVPQLADHTQLMQKLNRKAGVRYAVLTPNLQGLQAALKCQVDEVAIFGAASETFSQRNINCSIQESLERFKKVMHAAAAAGVPVRGYVSCVVGCPYEGDVAPSAVADMTAALLRLGCYEVSLGDTIGCGRPASVRAMLTAVLESGVAAERLAIHCHDTEGHALDNIREALQLGVRVVDASVAGLGGCPYAGAGASGNVATEQVVAALDAWGVASGVDLAALHRTAAFIRAELAALRETAPEPRSKL